jgi:hypothetical protein
LKEIIAEAANKKATRNRADGLWPYLVIPPKSSSTKQLTQSPIYADQSKTSKQAVS